MQSILLRHLEANAHTIVVIYNAAHGTHRSTAGKIQLAQGLDQSEQLLLLEEQADAIGSAGGKTRSTQQQTLQLDGMRLLIEGMVPFHDLPSILAAKVPSVLKVK